MLTEDELLRDYRYERSNLEEQGDELRRGERSVNDMVEQASAEINRMLEEIEGDPSEASNFARYRLNQISQEMNESFESEKKQVQNKIEQAEIELNQQLRRLH